MLHGNADKCQADDLQHILNCREVNDHPKALFRRATANAALLNYEAAMEDFRLCKDVSPALAKDVDRYCFSVDTLSILVSRFCSSLTMTGLQESLSQNTSSTGFKTDIIMPSVCGSAVPYLCLLLYNLLCVRCFSEQSMHPAGAENATQGKSCAISNMVAY